MRIVTDRLLLRPWREADRDTVAAMHADPEVMWDYGAPHSRAESDAKFERYRDAFEAGGFCRWAVEGRDGTFLGYVGVMPVAAGHPLAGRHEIGWRLARAAWGLGLATEAAKAALQDVFSRIGLAEVVAYTAADNLRSRAVMGRLGLQRRPELDFVQDLGGARWSGLVWSASAARWRAPAEEG